MVLTRTFTRFISSQDLMLLAFSIICVMCMELFQKLYLFFLHRFLGQSVKVELLIYGNILYIFILPSLPPSNFRFLIIFTWYFALSIVCTSYIYVIEIATIFGSIRITKYCVVNYCEVELTNFQKLLFVLARRGFTSVLKTRGHYVVARAGNFVRDVRHPDQK